jgi:hypothetical protein
VVDDEDRPARHAGVSRDVVTPHAVVGHHLSLEVADEVEGQATELFGKRLVREDRVNTDGVDADAVGDRVVVPGPKLGQLGPSTTREIEDIEKKDERSIFFQCLTKRQLLAACRGQLEVRRLVPDLQHTKSLCGAGLEDVPTGSRSSRQHVTAIQSSA